MIKTELTVSCPAKMEYIEYLLTLCRQTLAIEGVHETQKLCFAINEAIINSIEALSKLNKEDSLSLTLKITSEIVEVSIVDTAGGISPPTIDHLKNTSFESIVYETHGRGLLLIKTFVDALSFDSLPDGSNSVTLIKKRG